MSTSVNVDHEDFDIMAYETTSSSSESDELTDLTPTIGADTSPDPDDCINPSPKEGDVWRSRYSRLLITIDYVYDGYVEFSYKDSGDSEDSDDWDKQCHDDFLDEFEYIYTP